MAAPNYERFFSPEEYLALEREAEYKSEYIDGQIVAMSGVSREHSLINHNISRVLGNQLLEGPCEVHASDMRVRVAPTRLAKAATRTKRRGLYTYPDIVVVCGDVQCEDDHVDTLLNPTLIIEILSPSTETYDRGAKFEHYRQLPSLLEYVLVAQDHAHIEHYVRENGGWLLTEADDLDAVLELPSINCDLPLTEVYRRVEFPVEAADIE